MTDVRIIWDAAEDPDGNVLHIAAHGITVEEVEDVLRNRDSEDTISRSSGRPITFGYTSRGRYLAVVWEHVDDDPLAMYPITAYDAPERQSRRGRHDHTP
jgi:hypothetical protein